MNWRKAAAIIALLRDKHNPIGSSRSKPKGFFWVTCPEEGAATLNRYDSIIKTLAQERKRMAEAFQAAFNTTFQQPMY